MISGMFFPALTVVSVITGINIAKENEVVELMAFLVCSSVRDYRNCPTELKSAMRTAVTQEIWQNNQYLQNILEKDQLDIDHDFRSAIGLLELIKSKLNYDQLAIMRTAVRIHDIQPIILEELEKLELIAA